MMHSVRVLAVNDWQLVQYYVLLVQESVHVVEATV